MSGIVGILHLDGAPIDRALLGRMTDFMAFRGPDAQTTWTDGHVAFGHTLLRTTFEAEHEHQPFTLDGKTWIVADARVDAQDDLIRDLGARGEDLHRRRRAGGTDAVTDVELILCAYEAWGDDCVEHLLGDFAFAVWDGPRRRLFCARDQLGVMPFFYAQIGQIVIFSNTLDCIRLHPAVSDKLNDLAIADFLLFDLNQNPETTTYADIRRIPPAHKATWSTVAASATGMSISTYWTLPIDEPIFFKRAKDYTDRFTELLDQAVCDRLRTDKLAIFMSGGVDSTTLAATAVEILGKRSARFDVRAFTALADFVSDGREQEYAEMAANAIGIPIHYRDERNCVVGPAWVQNAFHTAEPCPGPMGLITDWEEFKEISLHARVVFYGEGPDNALRYEWRPYLSFLVKERRYGRLLGDIGAHIIRHRRIPLLPSLPRMLDARRRGEWWRPSFPAWLDAAFESRLQLRERWEEHERAESKPSPHLLRPNAHRSFSGLLWDGLFRGFDADRTRVPVEVRHPFLDLRLLKYMMAVPAVPWCRVKYLLRRAMRGRLPDELLRRRKAPLDIDSDWNSARKSGLSPLVPDAVLCKYVVPERVPEGAGSDMVAFRTDFRPRALNYWLQNLQPPLVT